MKVLVQDIYPPAYQFFIFPIQPPSNVLFERDQFKLKVIILFFILRLFNILNIVSLYYYHVVQKQNIQSLLGAVCQQTNCHCRARREIEIIEIRFFPISLLSLEYSIQKLYNSIYFPFSLKFFIINTTRSRSFQILHPTPPLFYKLFQRFLVSLFIHPLLLLDTRK